MISGSKCRWVRVKCDHLSAIIINILFMEPRGGRCIKMYMQDWFLLEIYIPFLSSSEARWILRWFCDQHGTGGQATRFPGSMPSVFYKPSNHIALSMPDNQKSFDIRAMRCDDGRWRQLGNTDGHELIYTGVFCAQLSCEPPSQSVGIPST